MVAWWSFGGAALLALVGACTNVAPSGTHSGRPSPPDAAVDASHDGGAPEPSNPIVLENALPGTREWEIAQPSPNHEIEAYADTTSAAARDVVRIFASASATTTFRWKLFRVGYYGGLGGRLIDQGDGAPITTQSPCPADPTTGLIECSWSPTFAVTVQPEWISGQYLFKLARKDGFETYVPLVIREAVPRAPFLCQASVTTLQAYNGWGGSSLYGNDLPAEVGFSAPRAYRVSFDRPYEFDRVQNLEEEHGAGHHFYSERHFVEWVERMGYDVAYATNIDVDADPALLMGRKLFASMGHDEYWSLGERRNVQNARDAGVSLGFFSANTAYWRIRLEPSASGTPRRIITCYKDRNLDPIHDAEDTTVRFRDGPHAQPENALIGQMYELYMQIDGFPLVIGDSHHWVYDGTGLSDGDTLTHVVGYEWDHVFADHNSPAGLEVVATSPVFGAYGSDAVSNVTLYAPTSSSIVFSAGTIQWAWGLGKAGYEDTRIQKITENVLARAGLVPHIHTVVSPPPPPTDIGVASKVTVVVGSGTAGHADGNFASASFAVPAGVAVDAHGNLLVTEARNHRVRKITPNGVVSTVAGCGPDDQTGSRRSTDGKQGKACFDTPTGIAVGLDGRVFVSDSHNHRIRVLDEDGNVQTYAGTGTADLVDSPNRKLAAFSYPRGLAIGPDGALYVADAGNGAIRRVTDDGVTTVVQGGDEVTGVAVAPDGTVYAIESAANQVAVLQGEMLVPIVNALGIPGDQNGPGNSALLRPADGIVVDGNALIVSDSVNQKIRRIALTPDHTVTTLVGDGNCGLRVGTGATTRLRNPRGIALWNGAYFVADSDNHRVLRVDP